ncbi:MAG: N-acyl homoserine lactonase family protein [Chloroflexi bacterium]|nr:N-acyl homoserine lactonase family protein [Chloroflexota bacterium]
MQLHIIQTGTVKITQNWLRGKGPEALRLARTLLDRSFTDWLPVNCFIIEHPEGLIVVDTGIRTNANDRIWFPPFMPLVQRAAPFQITAEQEIGPQMERLGLNPQDVRWLVQTHLHQDHEGGFAFFLQAEVIISRAEWAAAQGLMGRMRGYLNWRWPENLNPTLIDFTSSSAVPQFTGSHTLTEAGDVLLVSTPGHSAGHLSVIVEQGDHTVMIAGDAAYSQVLLLEDAIDGVGPDPAAQRDSHARILAYARVTPTIFLPSHDPDAATRLAEQTYLPVPE